MCVKTPSNSNNTTCGTAGQACIDCTKTSTTTCNAATFKCGGTGAGGGAGGGTGGSGGNGSCGSCTGCCTGATCIPLTAVTTSNCGHGGSTCAPCTGGNTCSTATGTCGMTPVTGVVGDGCSADGDCTGVDTTLMGSQGTSGGPALCQTQQFQLQPGATQFTPGATYQGGYCTRQCDDDAECGDGNFCGFMGGSWGEAANICYKGCDVDSDCVRTGYACLTINPNGSPSGICTPSLADGGIAFFDAGTPPARTTIGKPCTADTDCQAETAYGVCIKGTIADGGPSGYNQGYCSADCTMAAEIDSWCMGLSEDAASDGGSYCIPEFFADSAGTPNVAWFCVPGCTPGGTDCRTQYECVANPVWNDQAGDLKTCEPDCTQPSDCKAAGGCLTSTGCYTATCGAGSVCTF